MSISADRFQILQDVVKVCTRVLIEGVTDHITPQALARIVTVTEDIKMIQSTDSKLICEALNKWHGVWGIIIANPTLFL